jgi:hypothetical protein
MFGRRVTFGKRQQTLDEIREEIRPTPDADGVTRVIPKEIWDDPSIGSMLRECGFAPDDPSNIRRTEQDYLALFAAAKQRLDERTETFNREMAARHGCCRAAPFLVIDQTIYDGVHGAFLYAQLDLIGFDDWNVLMLATDKQTVEACGIAGHPGSEPAIAQGMSERLIEWRTRHDVSLEAYGITAMGGQGRQGITREEYEADKDALRREIIDYVGRLKPRIISELLRVQGL